MKFNFPKADTEVMEVAEVVMEAEEVKQPETKVKADHLTPVVSLGELGEETLYAVRHHHIHAFGCYWSPILGAEICQRNLGMFDYDAVAYFRSSVLPKRQFLIHLGSERYVAAYYYDGPYIPIMLMQNRPKMRKPKGAMRLITDLVLVPKKSAPIVITMPPKPKTGRFNFSK